MPPVRYKLISSVLIFFYISQVKSSDTSQITNQQNPTGRALFSPRVDYNNQWMPVGRGDPLKNDPTYDYSPPVLDRVRYWAESSSKNKDKNNILLLGVASKKASRKESKYNMPIRRNYYGEPPRMLMPPPMQALMPPHTSHSSSEIYHQAASSNYPQRIKGTVSDAHPDSSINYVSIARPNYVQSSMNHKSPYMTNSNGMYYSQYDQQKYHSSQHSSGVGSYTEVKKPFLHSLLQHESHNYSPKPYQTTVATPVMTLMTTTTTTRSPSTTTTTTTPAPPAPAYHPMIVQSIEITTESPMISPSTIFTPTVLPPSMTTDSLFSHYKQPSQPLTGPMYLIIEGHSKVKTYGLRDEEAKHTPKMVPVKSKKNPVIKHVVSEDDNGTEIIVKHLHQKQEEKIDEKPKLENKKSSMDNLLSFLDFGGFMAGDQGEEEDDVIVQKHKKSKRSIKNHMMSASYWVGEEPTVGKKYYRRGSVKTELNPHKLRN